MRIDYMVRLGVQRPAKGEVLAGTEYFTCGFKSEDDRNVFLTKLNLNKVKVHAQWTDYVSHTAAEGYHELGRQFPDAVKWEG